VAHPGQGLSPATDLESRVDVFEVLADGPFGQSKVAGDLPVGVPVSNPA
jgi:hypothetical protein